MSHTTVYLLLLGLTAGIFSGIVGIGGGIILVPAFVYIFSMTLHQAQGTTLAIMVPPIGILAAWTYYQQGYVDIKMAAIVALGFFFGGWFGAKFAIHLPNDVLRKIFAFVIIAIGIKMLAGK